MFCHWKGCRARTFAARLLAFESELVALRSNGLLDIQGMGSHAVCLALNTLLANCRLKFQWVHEAPYTVWQLDNLDIAAQFLASHDDMVANGQQPHRVHAHFAGSTSTLRGPLEKAYCGSRHD